jgi:TPR repeat protein
MRLLLAVALLFATASSLYAEESEQSNDLAEIVKKDLQDFKNYKAKNNNWTDIEGYVHYVQSESQERLKNWERAAAEGLPEGQVMLGNYYCYGGTPKENPNRLRQFFGGTPLTAHEIGYRWFRKAAAQGNADGQYALGMCYEYGLGVSEDLEESAKWYLKAAEGGDVRAQIHIGHCYFRGEGVPEDKTEGVKWYRKAAEQGDTGGQKSLGVCYSYGRGVPEDKTEGVKWYRQAAEQGDTNAMGMIGSCYFNGEGVLQDYVEAVKWYRQAAEKGNSGAQFDLGKCYYNGEGVAQDKAEAIKWYRQSATTWYQARFELMRCFIDGAFSPDEEEVQDWISSLRAIVEHYDADKSNYAQEIAREATELLQAMGNSPAD